MKRKRILREIDLDTEMFMDRPFNLVANLLLEQQEKLEKQGWTDIHLKMDRWYSDSELKVYGMRLENDTEFNKRKEYEKRKAEAAEKKLERERKKYKELKQKFEPNKTHK